MEMENEETPQLRYGNSDAISGEDGTDQGWFFEEIEAIDPEPGPRRADDELEIVEDVDNMFAEEH